MFFTERLKHWCSQTFWLGWSKARLAHDFKEIFINWRHLPTMAHVSPLATPLSNSIPFSVVFYNFRKIRYLIYQWWPVGFGCESCCSSKSFSHFWKTRALITAAQWSLVVIDLSITLFLKYTSLSRQICSVFDAYPAFSCFQLDCQNVQLACWSSYMLIKSARTVYREFHLEKRGYIDLTSYG